uniref:hypothetical protein n=1 Tax=Saccharothrix mutabilis TaxID=33921 RepID=UPI003CD0A424
MRAESRVCRPSLSLRRLLGTAALGASTAAAGKPRATGRGAPTFVLVHGANGNAGSFAPLVAGLAPAGVRLADDESWAVATDDARGDPATWGRVPRTYLRCTRDRAIPLALQDRMIAEADEATPHNRFDVHTLDAPHLGPRHPEPVVRVLVDAECG